MRNRPRPAITTALVYVRVSTSRQVQEGVGLDTQEAHCRAHAHRMGWTVQEVFRDEGLSGKDGVSDRPGLKALIQASRSSPDAAVVVYSISRLARRQRLLWSLIDDREERPGVVVRGLPIVSATEPFDLTTPMGRAMLGMIAVFAQLESDMISERTKDALQELKAQGKQLGAPNMVDLGMTETVSIIQGLYATKRYTHVSLADFLNEKGVPTAKKGGKWWPKTVRSALGRELEQAALVPAPAPVPAP